MTLYRKAGDHVQLLWGDTSSSGDLSQDSHTFRYRLWHNSMPCGGFGNSTVPHCMGQKYVEIHHEGYMGQDATSIHTLLGSVGAQTGQTVSAFLGSNATPVVGDIAVAASGVRGAYNVTSATDGVQEVALDFYGHVDGYNLSPDGRVLAPITTITETTTGTWVNIGSGTAGSTGVLHVLTATSTDSYAIIVQHSTTGAGEGEETTLLTFAADGQTTLGEWKEAAGSTLNGYVRYKATRTGAAADSFKFGLALLRL